MTAKKARRAAPGEKSQSIELHVPGEKSQPIELRVPALDHLSDGEAISCGLRMDMLSVGEGEESGSLSTGTGLGNDNILMEWKGRKAVIRGRDLFRVWVATFDKDSAKRLP